MDLTLEKKAGIDAMSYDEMLSIAWRTSKDSPMYVGAAGDYWRQRFVELHNERLAWLKRVKFVIIEQ
jgi:hypothetical protein